MSSLRIGWAIALAAISLIAAVPARALAKDSYIDRSDGSDASNNCHHRAKPCGTIVKGIATAGPGDIVFVGGDPQAYAEPLVLGDGKSLVRKNFSISQAVRTSGSATIDTGATAAPAVQVTSAAGRITGFRIRSEYRPLELDARARVRGNRFNEGADIAQGEEVLIGAAAGNSKVTGNTLVDPTPTEDAFGIRTGSTGTPSIAANRIQGFRIGVLIRDGTPLVKRNDVSGSHAVDAIPGIGIAIPQLAGSADPDIVGNRLHGTVAAGTTEGVVLVGHHAALARNRVSGYDFGISFEDALGPIPLSSDVIRAPNGTALLAIDNGMDAPGESDVRATNVTLVGSSALFDTQSLIKLDSSIVVGGVSTPGGGGCTITFSRGPQKTPGGNGCLDFQTTKSPRFRGDGYHLKRSSPLIDKGNPSKPGKRAKDVDGDRRALDGPDGGNCRGKARRDMGADEYRCKRR